MSFARLETKRDVALSILGQTVIALVLGLPMTFLITYWWFGGDLSRTLTVREFLEFVLRLTLIETLAICPPLAFRGATSVLAVNVLRHRMHRLAIRDPLTGLFNRRGFDEAIAGVVKGGPMAVFICDIDHFKRVNDLHGHDAGDEVLRAVAEQFDSLAELRSPALLARFGGEEFVAALPGVGLDQARVAAEMARLQIAARCIARTKQSIWVTASFGVAASPAFDGDMAALIARADAALYRAKNEGRDRVTAEWAPPRQAIVA